MKKKGIPSRYQEVEYIESTGTQYIDTGLIPKETFKYKIKYSLNAFGNQVLFGSRTSGAYNTSRNQIYFNSASGSAKTLLINLYGINDVNLNISPTLNDIVETPIIQNENCVIENATQPLSIFALNNAGTLTGFVSAKMYYFQIYDNTTLIRNFIPVYDTLTQKYGMWETVQGKFYGNDGTGDFKGSIVGYTIVGSPTITDGVVSGFSSANYLECQSPFTDVTDFEYNITFTVNNLSLDNTTSISRFSGPYGGLKISTSGLISLTFLSGSYTTINSDISAQNGEKYNANVKLSNGILSLRVKKDTDTQWNTKTFIVQEVSFGISFYYGRGHSQYNAFGGSIDMNETYIKVKNKLWFNGQQA